MEPFSSVSYLTQVRRLKAAASEAVRLYPVAVKSLKFIQHGENTVFKVSARQGDFLLRIHRDGYHDKVELLEEAKLLGIIAKRTGLVVPRPTKSKRGKPVETIRSESLDGARFCTLTRWVDGRFVERSLSLKHCFALGEAMGRIHAQTAKVKISRRRFWNAEGLVGSKPKFGSIDRLAGVAARDQAKITKARKALLKKLKAFERRFPAKLGFVHADLHFGNFLWNKGSVGVIDFDDCGWGLQAYDLAVTCFAIQGILHHTKRLRQAPRYLEELYRGYGEHKAFTQADRDVIPQLILARRLTMLGWLNARSDHPQIRKRLAGAVKRALKYV